MASLREQGKETGILVKGFSLVVGLSLVALGVAPVANAAKDDWRMLVGVRGDGIYSANVKKGKIKEVKELLPKPWILSSTSAKWLTADRQDSSNVSFIKIPKIRVSGTLYDLAGQRTVVGVSRNNAIILKTNPNGEKADVLQKNLRWGDERLLGSIDLLDEVTGNYGWIETAVSSPYGQGPVYFGAQERRPSDAGTGRGYGFTIYKVDPNGTPTRFHFIDSLSHNGYINDFCVSPSGRRIAFQNFVPGGSFGQEEVHVVDRVSGQKWSTQSSRASLGASCFVDDRRLVVSGSPPILMTLTNSSIKRKKLKGDRFADLVNAVEIVK